MAAIKYLVVALFCLSSTALLCDAVVHRLNLHTNFTLSYEVVNSSRSIDFVIEAKTPGWVAIGINPNSSTMFGADIFMGFVNRTSRYGADYKVRPDASQRAPQLDPANLQNWRLLNGTETNNTATNVTTTRLAFRRELDTRDVQYDHVIRNQTISLIWSFNNNSDDVSRMHSVRGAQRVNLITGRVGVRESDWAAYYRHIPYKQPEMSKYRPNRYNL